MNDDQYKLPRTISEAVRLLHSVVPKQEQVKIAAMTEDDLITLHFGLGQWIRNNLGLWQANSALLSAAGQHDPDDASSAIIRAFWQRLRNDLPKVH